MKSVEGKGDHNFCELNHDINIVCLIDNNEEKGIGQTDNFTPSMRECIDVLSKATRAGKGASLGIMS